MNEKKLDKALKILKLCGVVVLEKLWSEEYMSKVLTHQDKIVEEIVKRIADDPSLTNTTDSEQRSIGRYELRSPWRRHLMRKILSRTSCLGQWSCSPWHIAPRD